MIAATTTLSSVGVSNPISIDWVGSKPVTAVATLGSSTITADFTVQFTLDQLGSSATTPAWLGISSSIGASVSHFSSASFDTGVVLTFGYPIAGLRLSSTAISGSAITLKVLQGIGG